jgi:hypothetical protein
MYEVRTATNRVLLQLFSTPIQEGDDVLKYFITNGRKTGLQCRRMTVVFEYLLVGRGTTVDRPDSWAFVVLLSPIVMSLEIAEYSSKASRLLNLWWLAPESRSSLATVV